MHIPDSAGTDYFHVRADPLFNCQPCVDDNDSISEFAADEDEVSILPPMVTLKTESLENYSQCPNLDAANSFLSAVLNKFDHVMTPLPGCSDTITYDVELLPLNP